MQPITKDSFSEGMISLDELRALLSLTLRGRQSQEGQEVEATISSNNDKSQNTYGINFTA